MKKNIYLILGISLALAVLLVAGGVHTSFAAPATQTSLQNPNSPRATCNSGDVGGTVFRELPVNGASLNTYGSKDSNEPGVGDVTVTVVDANGTVITGTTAADGSWAVTPGAYPVRVAFSVPEGLFDGPAGGGSFTDVQFASSSNCNMDLGIHYPGDYSDTANPDVAIPRYENGLAAGNTDPALFTFPYSTSGAYGSDNIPDWGDASNITAKFQDIGATWGEAYQKERKRLFLASLLRRHSGLANGLGSIYVIDYTGAPPSLSHFDVSGVALGSVDRTGANVLGAQGDPNHDDDAMAKIGKVGLGDLEMSEDGQTLWAVNLYRKSLIAIDVSGDTIPGAMTEYTPTLPSCTGGEMRPWGLKFYMGKGWLGAVCDASVSQNADDLDAYVFSFDPANPITLTTEITFDLNYQRDTETYYGPTYIPWIEDETPFPNDEARNPQPILSDIEFGADGSMYLGFLDRMGLQSAYYNYKYPNSTKEVFGTAFGELLKVCRGGSDWILEGADASCPTNYNQDDGTGVAGNGEFFDDKGGDAMREYTMGALAILQGSGEIISSMNDPRTGGSDMYNSGLEHFSLADGSVKSGLQTDITDSFGLSNSDKRSIGMGKANGVGDIELLTSPAPLEIGNRLWCDTGSGAAAGNGIQDPGETPISNATVILQCDIDGDGFGGGDDVSASVTTDSNGNYLFKDGDSALSSFPTATWDNSLHIIPRNASCRILIAPTQSAVTSSCGAGNYAPSPANQGGDDRIDSDGAANVDGAGNTGVAFTTPASGQNNHDYDFGFKQQSKDWGDLPDTFGTDKTNNGTEGVGPSHVITSTLYLGSCVDAESDGQPDNHAGAGSSGGDDNNTGAITGSCTGNDDEDGVKLVTPLIPGGQACFNVTAHNGTNSAVSIYAWIDWNGDGNFGSGSTVDAGEAFTLGSVPANADWTNHELCTTVPSGATFDGGEVHMRFRYTTDALTGAQWGGAASDGEVEDYWQPLVCAGNYLWMDVGSTDNVQDSGDAPAPDNTQVNLTWGGADGNLSTEADNVTYTTTTTSGVYSFCGLIPDANGDGTDDHYQISVPTLPGAPVARDVGGDDALDNDGDNSGVGPDFTVSIPANVNDNAPNDADPHNFPDDNTNLTFDFGFKQDKVSIGNFVWHDANGNSQADGGEDGIGSVTLKLYRDSDGDGVCEPGSDTEVATAMTDNNGFYQFLSVDPSTDGAANTYYCVAVVKSTLPSEYAHNSAGGAHNPDATGDHDAPNGDDGVPITGYVISQPFPATKDGQSNTSDSGDPAGYSDASAYMTVDFGFLTQHDYDNMASPTAVRLSGMSARDDSLPWILGLLTMTLVGVATFLLQRRRAQ